MIATLQCTAGIEFNTSRDWRNIEYDVIGINWDLIQTHNDNVNSKDNGHINMKLMCSK